MTLEQHAHGDEAKGEAHPLLTEEEASALLQSASNAALFAVLKDIEYILSLKRVFMGFQAKPEGLKNPIARRRFITELINNEMLAEAVRAAANHPQASAAPLPKKPHPAKTTPPSPKPTHDAQLQAERDRLRRELRESHANIRSLEQAQDETQRQIASLHERLGAAQHETTVQHALAAAQEKRLHRQERELADARSVAKLHGAHAAIESPQGAPPRETKAPQAVKRPQSDLQKVLIEAMDRLLVRNKVDAVDLITEEMLRIDEGSIPARRMRARVRLMQGAQAAALDDLRFVFAAHLAAVRLGEAARTLLQACAISDAPDEKLTASLFAACAKNAAGQKEVASVFLEVWDSPITAALHALCKEPLASRLFLSEAEEDANPQLPKELKAVLGDDLTVQRIIRAIDRGEEEFVNAVRRVAVKLNKIGIAALNDAFGSVADSSYAHLLTRRTLVGAAVVDSSNIANYERQALVSGRPRLDYLIAVRAALRDLGYFPVVLIADANLPHLIDHPPRLRQMILAGEVQLVHRGTVADERILSEARRLEAVVISNDYMADWDPAQIVPKAQFSISLTDGKASFYF